MFSKKKPGGKYATTVTVGCGIIEYLHDCALDYVEGSIGGLDTGVCSTLILGAFIFHDERGIRTERDSSGIQDRSPNRC